MPRLFTGLALPAPVAAVLASIRGGLPGARWIEPADYHITLRFLGDVDGATARDFAAGLDRVRNRAPLPITLDEWSAFGGAKPRALIARVAPDPGLSRLQAEQERLARECGLEPETRKFTPHVTLARLRGPTPDVVAGFLAGCGLFPRQVFTADRFVLYSARDSVGGGPYRVEAEYPLDGRTPDAGDEEEFDFR